MDKITVVVPIYNVEKYLEECVSSLCNQTYENIEIVLINDGSTDKSGHICKILKHKDARIIVINQDNQGLGMARNTGLRYASGKYITFIDSDDYADENMIQELVNGIVESNSDTCIGGFTQVSNNGKILFTEKYRKSLFEENAVYNEFFPRMLGSLPNKKDAITMSACNSLYSMNIIKENNLQFCSEREFISEDIIFASDYYRYAKKVNMVDSALYYYRVNASSLTHKYNPERFTKVCILYKELEQRIIKYNIGNSALKRMQKMFFINLKMCFNQENTKISKKKFAMARRKIIDICRNGLVVSVIKSFPINELGLIQRLFVYMVKYKMAILLLIFVQMNALKERNIQMVGKNIMKFLGIDKNNSMIQQG